MQIGDKISFRYIVITLHTDYIGKNEEWFSGEIKRFFKGGMKNLKIIGE